MNLKKLVSIFSVGAAALSFEPTNSYSEEQKNFTDENKWQVSELWKGKYHEDKGNFWFFLGGNPNVAPFLLGKDVYALRGVFHNITPDKPRGLESFLLGNNLFLKESKIPIAKFKSVGTMKEKSDDAFFQTYIFARADNKVGRFVFHYNILGNQEFVDRWRSLDMQIKSRDVLATTGVIIEPNGEILEDEEWEGKEGLYAKSFTATGSKLEFRPGPSNTYGHVELPEVVIYSIEPIESDRFQQQIISRKLRKEFLERRGNPDFEKIK